MENSRISKTVTVDKLEQREDHSDLPAEFGKLSTASQSDLQVLLQNLASGEAILKIDKDGKQFIDYQVRKISLKKKVHPSQANKIVVPKSDTDLGQKVQACLELIGYVKNEKNPAGVSLDTTKTHLEDGEYREGENFEFTRTKKILGHGLYGGDIIVVKDNKTEETHALKTIMISVFRNEEIQCWVDLSDSGCFPSLYLFKMNGNMVEVHMEILRESHTMQSIIDSHLHELDPSLLKPFSLFVLNGSLEAVSAMHENNWVHNDLHEGNIMLQKSEEKRLQLKIIDFGRASRYEDPEAGFDYRGFRSDIRSILGMCCSVFGGSKIYDFHLADWATEIGGQLPDMSDTDKLEVLYLVKLAMDVVQPADVREYRLKVKKQLDKALEEIQKTEMDVLKEVVEILFPEAKQKQDPVQLDEADGTEDSSCFKDSNIQFKKRQARASNYKTSGLTVVSDELIDNLLRSMSIGPC